MPARNAEEAFKRYDKLKSDRSNWETLWQDVADYVIPNKNDVSQVITPGQKRNLQVFDGSGIQSNELLAGALHGMLTNPSSFWFELFSGIPEVDRDDEARKWFQRVARTMHEVMNNSNFQTEIHELYLDLCSFGTAMMSVEEDKRYKVRFLTHHITRFVIDEDQDGMVDCVFVLYKWKPQQVIDEFGEAKVPSWVKDKAMRDAECDIDILQEITTRDSYDNKAIDSSMYKIASCWYIRGDKKPETIREAGFRTMPAVTPRWTKGTGEKYGRSPSMKALPDIKMINKMMYVLIQGAEKAVNPPLLIPDDSVIGTVKTYPGGLNLYRGGTTDFIRPLETGTKIDMGYQIMEDVRKRIREAFYIDQLQLQEGPQMTATEVLQRTEEKIRLLGPILGRQHFELLQPLIERVYEICDRSKMFPPLPRIMVQHRAEVRVQYRSMLAKAQLATEANNILRTFQAGSPFFQLDPNSRDIVDCEEGVRYVANLYGLPAELIRDADALKAIREGRAQAQQNMIAQQQQETQVDQATKLLPALSKAGPQQ